MQSKLLLLILIINSIAAEQLFICNKFTCPKGRGVCEKDNTCVCEKGYSTIDSAKHGDFYCNYKKKSQLISFLLEFIVSFGAGHFYLGNFTIATVKMIFTAFTCILFCQYHSVIKITEFKNYAKTTELVSVGGWICWQIIDAFLLGFGFYNDGNGIELKGI